MKVRVGRPTPRVADLLATAIELWPMPLAPDQSAVRAHHLGADRLSDVMLDHARLVLGRPLHEWAGKGGLGDGVVAIIWGVGTAVTLRASAR